MSTTIKELKGWLEDELCRFNEDPFLVIKDEQGLLLIKLYTAAHSFHIKAREAADVDDKGYLGCTGSTRTPRPGEDHTRGNDLADGDLTRETWEHIKNDILAYELKPIFRAPDPMADIKVPVPLVEENTPAV